MLQAATTTAACIMPLPGPVATTLEWTRQRVQHGVARVVAVQARRRKSVRNKVDMVPRLEENQQDADRQLCSKSLFPKTKMSNLRKLLVEVGGNEPSLENKQPNLP